MNTFRSSRLLISSLALAIQNSRSRDVKASAHEGSSPELMIGSKEPSAIAERASSTDGIECLGSRYASSR